MNREAKYRLAFSASGAAGPGTPSGGGFQTLAGALAAGWANDSSGGRPLAITLGGLPVMREEDLRQAFERLRAVESGCPEDNKIDCAARVLREMGLE